MSSEPKPTLTPTKASVLIVLLLAGAGSMLLIAARFYSYVPRLSYYTSIALIAIAIVLMVLAITTKSRINGRGDSEPPDGLMVARYAVLAKACSHAGALFVGVYLSLLLYAVVQQGRLAEAADDLPRAAVGFAACVILVGAALWLEWACRIPDDDEPPSGNHGVRT